MRSSPARREFRRETVFAAVLTLLLTVGVVGVLLLNMSMQAQQRVISTNQQRIATLQQRAQLLRAAIDREADPALLARRALALHLQPVRRVRFIAAPAAVTARRQAAGSVHAG
jgi:hypothetical protein